MPKNSARNPGLEALLELNNEVFLLENGYWTKIEARRVKPSREIPHGIRYSLTLHNRYGTRIMGFDNAHRIKPTRKQFAARKTTWDHTHYPGRTVAYEFKNAGQLLQDFWVLVDELLK